MIELIKHYPEENSIPLFEGITIKPTDRAMVYYNYDTDQLFIRHVIHEGPFCSFVQHENDQEFAPSMEYNRFYYIGPL